MTSICFKTESASKLQQMHTSSTPNTSRQRLFVDVSVITQSDAHTGIQRVVRAILGALLSARIANYIVCPVVATRKSGYVYADPSALLFLNLLGPSYPAGQLIEPQSNDIFLGLDLSANILPKHRREIKNWRRRGCLVAVVMYDLLPEQRPEWFNPKTRRRYRRWLRVVTSCSDRIICISKQVDEDLGNWLRTWPWRGNKRLSTQCMRLGSELDLSMPTRGLPENAKALTDEFSSARTLLVVGTIEPRKGHACLLPALEELWKDTAFSDVKLVFVGKPGWRTDDLQARLRMHPERDQRLYWFDSASDEFLALLYAASDGVIVPSLAEGFGLPLVEAVSYGKAVLARNLPVFRTMNLARVTYFDQHEPSHLAATIKNWLTNLDAVSPIAATAAPTWAQSFADLMSCLSIHDVEYLKPTK